jgi:hypothetical protein
MFNVMNRTKALEFNSNFKSFSWESNKEEKEEERKILGCEIGRLSSEDFLSRKSKVSNRMPQGGRSLLRHRLGRRWLQLTDKTPPEQFDPVRAKMDRATLQRTLRQGRTFPQYINQGPFFAMTEKNKNITSAERARRDAIINTMRVNQAAQSFIFEGASHLLLQDVQRGLPLIRTAAALIAHNQATAKHELMMAEDKTRTIKLKQPPPDQFQVFDEVDDKRSEEVAKQEQTQRDLHRSISKSSGFSKGGNNNQRFFGSRSPKSKRKFFTFDLNSPQTGRNKWNNQQRAGSAGSFRRANNAGNSDNSNARDGTNENGNRGRGWNGNNNNNSRGPNARSRSTGRK